MNKKVVVIVRQEGLGSVGLQDRPFGRDMLDKFLHTLEGQSLKPHAICFYTEGVRSSAGSRSSRSHSRLSASRRA